MIEPAHLSAARSPRARWTVALAALVLAAIWLAMLVGGTGPLDQRVYQALYVGGHPAWIALARAVTIFGQPEVLIAASVLFLGIMWRRGHLRTGLTLLVVTMVGRVLGSLQKVEIGRVRPDLQPHLVIEQTKSFPSGHATSSMIFYLTLALVLTHRGPWRRPAAAAAIIASMLIGTSRVMLGVHWPSDVIGGWVFGLLWVLLTLPVAEHLLTEKSVRR